MAEIIKKVWNMMRPFERVAAVWCVLTLVLMLCMSGILVDPKAMLLMRLEWIAATAVAVWAGEKWKNGWVDFGRLSLQLAWLGTWYPDTFEFNRSFQNLDHLFATAEYAIFHGQPALDFSEVVTHPIFSEAFCFGYGSYFFMMVALCMTLFFMNDKQSVNCEPVNEVGSVLLISFCLFYIIYIFVPVAGPQFYFPAIGLDNARAGVYPALGTYFSSHAELLPCPGWEDGFFRWFVDLCHKAGERPTAAFPSSHVGVATIVMVMSFKRNKTLAWILFPIYVLLCLATVYIKAHYVIDAVAGFVVAFPILWIANKIYKKVFA